MMFCEQLAINIYIFIVLNKIINIQIMYKFLNNKFTWMCTFNFAERFNGSRLINYMHLEISVISQWLYVELLTIYTEGAQLKKKKLHAVDETRKKK